MLESRLGHYVMADFLRDCQHGGFHLMWNSAFLPRVEELVRQYADLRLGTSDAAVIALAEDLDGRVATTNVRDFYVVQAKKQLTILP